MPEWYLTGLVLGAVLGVLLVWLQEVADVRRLDGEEKAQEEAVNTREGEEEEQ